MQVYCGAELWHIPGLTRTLHTTIKFASANALKLMLPNATIMNMHTEIHAMAGRALPDKICLYRPPIIMHKLINEIMCEDEFIQLNFQLYGNERSTKMTFLKMQKFEVRKTSC